MARNVEIKARLVDPAATLARAAALADGPAQAIEQDDTFFACAHGRLKLREFADGSAELIHYERADGTAARMSDYVRCAVSEPTALREALTRGLGVLGRVRKRRLLLLIGPTRVHLDEVLGVGSFMELEVVLRPEQTAAEGAQEAERLMLALGLAEAQRCASSYLEMLKG